MENPLISIVVASYNSDPEKLKKTILSALLQEGITFDIIVADDGSEDNHFSEIEDFFKAYNFKDYQLVVHEKNGGTVANVYDGLALAKGKYAKLISPGDYLYSKTCLKETAEYMEEHQLKACFSDAVYYEPAEPGKYPVPLSVESAPALKSLFKPENYNRKKCFLDYLALQDGALGAAFLTETALLKKYLEQALGKLLLFEDFTYAYMMYCGEKICYYPRPTVWYEYGTGVSTSGGEKQQKRYEREFAGLKGMILNTPEDPGQPAYEKKYRKMLENMPFKSKGDALVHRYWAMPGTIGLKLKRKFGPEKTPGPEHINTDFFTEIDRKVSDGN